MKSLARIAPFLILSAYFTVGNLVGFRLPAMRVPAVAGLALMAVALYQRKRTSGLSAIDKGFLIFLALNVGLLMKLKTLFPV